jgi:hypothetical protein
MTAPEAVKVTFPSMAFLWDSQPSVQPALTAAAEGGKITRREFAAALQAAGIGGGSEPVFHTDPDGLL